jgi:hypothetical protein
MFGSGVKHGILATLMALVLSHLRGTSEHSSSKSLNVYVIQSSCEQQLAAATYLAYVVDWATLDYLQEDQEISEDPKNWHPAKSASENPRSERQEDVEYQRPSSGLYRRYQKIRLTACWCEVLGDAWKLAHRHTENWMYGLVTVKYKSQPIMLRYSFCTTGSPPLLYPTL